MKKQFENLKKHKLLGNQKDFNKTLAKLLPQLEQYVRHRIRIFEAQRKLPENYYSPADVLADVYLQTFNDFDIVSNEKLLKIKMFTQADKIIQSYVEKENKPNKKIPIAQLLQDELKIMYEKLTANADGEVLLTNDLKEEDIEYQQDEFKPKVYLFDYNTQNAFAQSLGLTADDFRDEKLRSIFGNLYSQLPEIIRRILDLNALGGLSSGEIAEILEIQTDEVEKIIIAIKEKIVDK